MKQPRILFLVVIALLPLVLLSCSGTAQLKGGWSGPAVYDGIIYVGTRDGRVVALNASTQSKLWDYSVTPASPVYTTPMVTGDSVYVGTYSGQVLALSPLARSQNLTFPQQRYGEWRWNCPLHDAKTNAIVADLAMSEDALYVASSNGRVYSLDKRTGDENWRREDIPILAEKLWKAPAIQRGALYVSTFGGNVSALSAETGKLLDWSFKAEAGFASPPIIYEGIIYAGSFDNNLYAIRIDDGKLLWKFRGGKWFWAAPLVSEGVVYAACLDGRVYALDAESGKELWPQPFESEDQRGKPAAIVASPVLIGNLLIVANEAGNVYIVNSKTGDGERIRNRENGDKPTINAQIRAPLCAHEGILYIRGEDNRLYAVDIESMKVSEPIPLSEESEGRTQ